MDNFLEMLEHMSNMGVLVISQENHAVLYYNRCFKKAFPDMIAGKRYEEFLPDRYAAALNGFFTGSGADTQNTEKNNRIVLDMPEFGGNTDVNIDQFLWDGGQKAYVLYFSPQFIREEDRFKDEAERTVNSVLEAIYPVIAAINLSRNNFMVFKSDDEVASKINCRGDYNEGFRNRLLSQVHPQERDDVSRKCNREYLLQAFISGQKEVHLEFRIQKADAEYRWIALRFVKVFSSDQENVSAIALFRDVDYRMNQRMKLQATLDATYSAIPGGIVEFLIDDKFTILKVNDAFCELVGKQPENYMNGYKEHILKEDREETSAVIYEAAREGKPFDVVYRVYNGTTGKIHWVQCRGVKIDERDGIPVYLGIRLDVSDLKNAEIGLLEERARADIAMGSSGNVRYEYDKYEDTLSIFYQFSNEPGQLHKTSIEHYCKTIHTRGEVHPEDMDKILSVFAGDNRKTIEVRLKNLRMNHFEWYRIKSTGISDSSGRVYVVGFLENVEKEKKLEFINQNLQEQIEFVIRDSFKRIYLVDVPADSCTVMYMNSKKHKKPLHTRLSRLEEIYVKSRIHPEDLAKFEEKYSYVTSVGAFTQDQNELNFDMRVRDGFGPEYHWYTFLVKPLNDEKQRFICMTKCVDEMRKKEELDRKILEQIRYKKFSEKIIESLGTLVEFRDGDSGAHIMRTRQLTDIMLNYLTENVEGYHFSEEEIDKIATASAMHDVGKISIPDAILNKPGRLTKEEFDIMKTHSVKGYNILKKLDLGQDEEFNTYCLDICRWHHERYDGNGYPDHLVGDEIPIWSQIVGIVDVYDALVSPRVYKNAFSHEQAMKMIIAGECGCFNPNLLEGLKSCAEHLRACYE